MHRRGHTFSQNDIFQSYDLNNFKFKEDVGTARKMKKIYKYRSKTALVAKIFWTFMKLVIRDLVKDGITFHLNTKTIAMFTWKSLTGSNFVKAYQSGKFDDIDFLSTNFTIYMPIFKYFYKDKFKECSMIMDKSLRKERNNKINKGFKYC